MKKIFSIKIDSVLCKRCGICLFICPKNVFYLIDESIKTKDETCVGCNICEMICPDLAISIEEG